MDSWEVGNLTSGNVNLNLEEWYIIGNNKY